MATINKKDEITFLRHYIPGNKGVLMGLTVIYGIGITRATLITARFGLRKTTLIKNLSNKKLYQIRKMIESSYIIDSALKRYMHFQIKTLIMLSTYKGTRHRLGLPVRGQRSHTNARTQKKLSKIRVADLT